MNKTRGGIGEAARSVAALAAVALALGAANAFAASTNVNWIGGGNTSDWYDAANWEDGNVPKNNAWRATITSSVDLVFTNLGNLTVNRITTAGSGHVTLGFNQINCNAGTGYTPSGGLVVGPGGVTMNKFSSSNGGGYINAGGNLKIASFGWGNTGSIQQNAGVFEFASFLLPISGNTSIRAWVFTNNTPSTIYWTGYGGGTYQFVGTPTFLNGHRPHWQLGAGYEDGRNWCDLNGFTMLGDEVRITGAGAPSTRWGRLINDDPGGTVDANKLIVGYNNYRRAAVQLANTDVVLRGSGAVYDNRSTNAAAFWMTNAVTVTFDPAAGICDLDSGSEDRDSTDFDPADWADNFAFDLIRVGDGDTITLLGDANLAAGNNAVYARTIEGLGAGGTVALNGRNVYLLEPPVNVAFDSTGGGAAFWPMPKGTLVVLR